MISGYCTNLPSACAKAATKEAIPMSAPDSKCPECGSGLLPLRAGGGGGDKTKLVFFALLGALLIGLGLLAAYFLGGDEVAAPVAAPTVAVAPAPAAPVAAPAATPTPVAERYLLRLSGSNTIGAALAPRLVEAWLASQGATGISSEQRRRGGQPVPEVVVRGELRGENVAVEIRAHGSGTAFKDLLAGSADVGMASRPINAEESNALAAYGDMTGREAEHVIALDGIAVVVAPGNPLRSISRQDLARVFAGEVSDWSQLGAGAGPIQVYARDDQSGTYDTFKHLVLGGKPLVASAQRYEDSAALEAAVAADAAGIGFVGLPYVKSTHALAVSDGKALALSPTLFTVKKEDYALSRRLFLYIAPNSSTPQARAFARFVQSIAGQEVVKAAGFVDQNISRNALAKSNRPCSLSSAWPQGREAYCRVIAGKTDLGTNFRFRTGSAELDNRAVQDLQRVLALMAESPERRLTLVGFADAQGAYGANARLSQDRATAVKSALATLGISAVDSHGFGEEIPVADNELADGRERNRRVEVWID